MRVKPLKQRLHMEQGADLTRMVDSLRRQGISQQALATAVTEAHPSHEVQKQADSA